MWLKRDIIEMWYKWDMSLNHIKKYVNENCIAPKDKILCFNIITSQWLDEYTKYLFCLQHLLEWQTHKEK